MVKMHSHAHNQEEWLSHIKSLRGDKDAAALQAVINLYQDKKSPLLEKGLGIADILLSLGLDTETLGVALIYPAIQAHEIHRDALIEKFSDASSKLLHDVQQIQSLGKFQQLEQRSIHHLENLRKMLLAMVSDVRAVLMIIAERLWQLRFAKHLEKTEQQKLATQTLEIFAPLANRLGIWQLKWEIEDLCLRYLQPEIYTEIAKGLAARRQEREQHLQDVSSKLTHLLEDAKVPNFQVTGRVKHIYSIYNKMQRKKVSLDKIYDVGALRVLVSEVNDCYTVLSILQNTWQQIQEEFDDYINRPKPNGYRSIHTVVIGPNERVFEIQIRTYQMHQESELGVAAHWRYKEGVLQTSHYEAKIALLRQIMAWQKEIVDTDKPETKQALHDLFTDQVYVFTPMGDIIDLPQGATPLDFAYQIHSEVGHRCRGAKIGGNIVPLTYQLKTGERVEILTAKEANPSRDWLNPHLGYLKTARARAKAQHWFRMRDSLENIAIGHDALEKELKKLRINEKYDLRKIAEKLNYKTDDDLLAALGLGDIGINTIIHQIQKTTPTPVVTPAISTVRPQQHDRSSHIQIQGVNNLLTQIALCCKPLPGDNIIGYVTRNRGVSIHRKDCGNISNTIKTNANRIIEVNWKQKESETHPVELLVRTIDRTGMLRDITTTLAGDKINVFGLHTIRDAHASGADIQLTLEVGSLAQLNRAIKLLQQVPGVMKVIRR